VSTVPLQFTPMLSEEDRARADYYALLSRLYFEAPDRDLLAAIAAAAPIKAEAASPIVDAWAELQAACAIAAPDAVALEFATVFIGTGKAPVTPYCSYYVDAPLRDRFLVRLRETLDLLGLARVGDAGVYEDHIAGLCEVMRHLVLQGSSDAALQQQKELFINYIQNSYEAFSRTVMGCESAVFFKPVARFSKAFLDIEKESLSMV
jgi:TorA maturation chaperone TorD